MGTQNRDTLIEPSREEKRGLYIAMMAIFMGGLFLVSTFLLDGLPMARSECTAPCVPGSEDIMSQKAHGTSETPVQENLRWGCNRETADRICVSSATNPVLKETHDRSNKTMRRAWPLEREV